MDSTGLGLEKFQVGGQMGERWLEPHCVHFQAGLSSQDVLLFLLLKYLWLVALGPSGSKLGPC